MVGHSFKQSFALIRQNHFFSVISVLGTALSITFVMVIYMVYDLTTANIAPEIHRDRMIYSGVGYSYRTENHSNSGGGMSLGVAREIFDSLPGAEVVSYTRYGRMVYAGATTAKGSRQQLSYADENLWKIYDIRFLAGRPFSSEEYAANRDVVVITEHIARKEFGSAEEAVGKNLFINFRPVRVVGVTEDISSLFIWAFSDMWRPYDPQDTGDLTRSEGVSGSYTAMLLRRPGVSSDEVKEQVAAAVVRLNQRLNEYTFELKDVSTIIEKTFFTDFTASPGVTFAMLAMILLIVPAINISGFVSSQMSHRLSELGIRKAYGATNRSLIVQLLTENMLLTVAGAVVGFILSCFLLYLMKDWMLGFGDGGEQLRISIFLVLRPSVFLCAFIACLLFNLMSVLIPAWSVTRHDIITTLKGE
ncbi:ABC transporter permease [Bacteroides sp.]